MSTHRVLGRLFVMLLLVAYILPLNATDVRAAGAIWYVKADASGTNTGATWANAFTDLQSALAAASAGDQVWVAKGVYYPSSDASDRTASFELKDGVAIYGGFAGSETVLNQRDWQTNQTVLSGDIDQNDVRDAYGVTNSYNDIVGNNSYRLMHGNNLSAATVLDGFTISAGSANISDSSSPYFGNSGINLINSSPILNNLHIIGNKGHDCTSIQNDNGSPQISNSSFIANTAGICSFNGGRTTIKSVRFLNNHGPSLNAAIRVDLASIEIVDSRFEGNISNGEGAVGLYQASNSSISNTTFISNTATLNGGAIATRLSEYSLDNVVFEGNSGLNGGAIFNHRSKNSISNSRFINNQTDFSTMKHGGAIYNEKHSELSLTQVDFIGNQADGYGGALFNTDYTTATLELVTFRENHAVSAGAFNNEGSQATLLNVTFSGNTAQNFAGALYTFSDTSLTNVVFSGNKSDEYGGALVSSSGNTVLTNTSFNGNYAGIDGGALWTDAIARDSHITLQNSLVWDNQPNSMVFESTAPYTGNSVTIASSLVEGCKNPAWNSACGIDAGNNLADADPLFVTPIDPNSAPSISANLMLKATSPAIDQGDNSLNSSSVDLGGAPRVVGSTIDLGAYEWQAFTLSVASEGQGTAQATPQQATYQPGDQVVLSAVPAAGWEFAGWSGSFTGSDITTTLTIAQSHVITATFRNLPPIVVVDPNQTVDAGDTVTLDASGSHDLDTSQTLSYMWQQVGGSLVNLSNANTAQPSFTAPPQNGVLVFELVVSDNLGAVSEPVLVTVTVQNDTSNWKIFLPLITTE